MAVLLAALAAVHVAVLLYAAVSDGFVTYRLWPGNWEARLLHALALPLGAAAGPKLLAACAALYLLQAACAWVAVRRGAVVEEGGEWVDAEASELSTVAFDRSLAGCIELPFASVVARVGKT